jgi:transglutaminase-like putative cysteine protease
MRARLDSMLRRIAVPALAALLAGCASLGTYFHDAGAPPAAPLQFDLSRLPFSEYWTHIVFNGERIGFSRFSIRSVSSDPARYEINSEASFVLRFLGIEKKVTLKARDTVEHDLALVDFAHEYHIDGSELRLAGRREKDGLVATIVTGGKPTEQRLPVQGRLYPSGVIGLFPVVSGLALGREYTYQVYSGQVQALAQVTQRVAAYERSQFFTGNAFRIETSMRNQRVTTWIDQQGRPAFELSLQGVMISAIEDPGTARRYVALASLNKKEGLVEFSLIRPQQPIERPREVTALRVALQGIDELPPTDGSQRCERVQGNITCEMRRVSAAAETGSDAAADAAHARYLRPSISVQSHDPSIRSTASEIVRGSTSREERIARIVEWLRVNVEKVPLDVFSALDVLEKRKAECQGHAYLYAAFARAAGIPTRVVNGLVYSQELQGFLYHSWNESLVGGRWLPVDPTFSQTAVDATHIKIVEGESLADLMPLLDWVGKTKIRVLAVEHQ